MAEILDATLIIRIPYEAGAQQSYIPGMAKPLSETETPEPPPATPPADAPEGPEKPKFPEIGGRKGLDPTRYGDWEKDGRCVDF